MMTFVKEVQEIFFPKLYIQLIAKKALGLISLKEWAQIRQGQRVE
jgi:hypothetical protein